MHRFSEQTVSIRELMVVARPFWWVNTAMPFVAGYFIIAHHTNWTLLIGIVYFAFIYNLLMYGINDIYDYESDIINPRKIGIHGSVLPKTKHPSLWTWIVVLNLPFMAWFIWHGSLLSNIWFVLMIGLVCAYSVRGLRFKEVPFLDSFTSSFHYTSPFVYALLLSHSTQLYLPAFLAFYLWVMANHAFGAIQDITPDREAGINSIATTLGARRTIIFVFLAYLIAASLPAIAYGPEGLLGSLLLVPYVIIIAATLPYRKDDQAPAFKRAWKQFLYTNYATGCILTIALLLIFHRLG